MIAPKLVPPGARPQAEMTPLMIAFNPRSEELLAGVNPQLAELMRRVEKRHPDAFEITEGMRDRDRQAKLVAEGKSQTMNSKHLTGHAVDIAMMGPDGQPNWDFEAYRPIAETAKAEAAALGIPDFVWGGDWKTLKDGVHFQIGGGGNSAAPMSSGANLSFGTDVAPVQDTSALGLAMAYGTGGPAGLQMGMPVAVPRPAANPLVAEARQAQDLRRRIALADLMRF